MRVTTPDGRTIRVGRRWRPWRPRPREFESTPDIGSGVIGGDDPVTFILSVVLALVLVLLAPLLLTLVVLLGEIL